MESFFEIISNSKFNEDDSKIIEISVNSLFLGILNEYSPIKNLQIDIDDARIFNGVSGPKGEEEPYFEIKNLKTKFLVGEQWLKWYMLSDGTKRIFYLL